MPRTTRGIRRVALSIALAPLAGCVPATRGPATPPATIPQADRAALLVDGTPIGWGALRPMLSETAGGIVVEEAALDVLLEREARAAGVVVADEDLAFEEAELRRSVQAASASDQAQSAALIERVRRSRGLGPQRYQRLLRRNALLRRLTEPDVAVSASEIDLAFRIRWGERRRTRVLVAPGEHQAARLRSRVLDSPDSARSLVFARLAVEESIDASARAGGYLGEISPVDPGVPMTLRRAVRDLEPNELSPVLALEGGYGIAMVEAVIPADGGASLDEHRAEIEAALLRRKQRLAMDRLAAELLARASISVLDPALGWSRRAARAGD